MIYVGDFTQNKNILHLLHVIRNLSKTMEITLARGAGNGLKDVLKLLNQKSFEFAEYVGNIESIDAISTLYARHHIFIMLSKFEILDLVYIEARSQRLPMLHTAGQRIDGYFINSSFAIPVKANDKEEKYECA